MVFSKLIKCSPFRGLGGFCLILFAFGFQPAQAQTWSEWWAQKKTQISYLGQQIIALNQLRGYVRQGYNIAQHGLGEISGFTGGEMNLHGSYYNSLKKVNSAIKDDPRATEIATYADAIPPQFDHLNALNGLDAEHRRYVTTVRAKVLDDIEADINELQLVMTSGEAEMTDDERLKRLDQIRARLKDKYAFTLNFCNQVRLFLMQKKQETETIQTLRQYEIR